MKSHLKPLAALLAACPLSALAAEAIATLDEIVVTAARHAYQPITSLGLEVAGIAPLRSAGSDSASLLRDVPGVSLLGAGGVSSLPAIHGLADDRVNVQVDGMDLISACPNHMNSPLSYIDPSNVASAKVYAGLAPVSAGGDSLGGSIHMSSPAPVFAAAGQILTQGQVGTFYRSNGDAHGANLSATLASNTVSFNYTGSTAQAGDYKAGADFKTASASLPANVVGSTSYESENQEIGLALRHDDRLLELKVSAQNLPHEDFPNQRMDMTQNDSTQVNLHYVGQQGWGKLDARAYSEDTRHEMDFGADKQFVYGTAHGMPMNTTGNARGAKLQAELALSDHDTLRLGSEFQNYRLNDWWPPSGTGTMSPSTFWNIDDGKRDRYAVFGEWESRLNPLWTSQVGLRHETVDMNTGNVAGYAASNGMAPMLSNQLKDSTTFNAQDHGKTDQNWDLTALARYIPSETSDYAFGYARKTRSPNLYERYTWSTWSMAAVMNNFAGEANGYVGNLNLKPEVAHTLSFTGDWHDADREHWDVKVTPYATYVQDYIDAQCLPGTICTASKFNVLQHVNQSARIQGLDLAGHLRLGSSEKFGRFTATGLVNYVQGENRTTGDHLYDMMPLNVRLALVQTIGHWSNTIESRFVAAKTEVSAVRNEIKTPGYSLCTLRSSYEWRRYRVDFGVDNLFDRQYALPLGGTYVGQGATMSINGIPWGVAVPGMGRTIHLGLNLKF